MNAIRITCSSASYDEDISCVVEDTPRVRRAIEERRKVNEVFGDGETEVDFTGSIPDITEDDFVDWVILDVAEGTGREDEVRAYIDGRD